MTETTVRQFAKTVGVSEERLLQQLDAAGLSVQGPDQVLSDEEKTKLLSYLRAGRASAAEPTATDKVLLRRKSVTQLRVGGSHGRGKTVAVEVRKRRTIVKPQPEAQEAPETAAETPSAPLADLVAEGRLEGASVTPAPPHEAQAAEVALEQPEPMPEEASPALPIQEAAGIEQAEMVLEAKGEHISPQESDQPPTEVVSPQQARGDEGGQEKRSAPAPKKTIQTRPAPGARARPAQEARPGSAEGMAPPRTASAEEGTATQPPSPEKGGVEPDKERARPGDRASKRRGSIRMREEETKPVERVVEEELHLADDAVRIRRRPGRRDRAGEVRRHGFERPVAPMVREVVIPAQIKVGELAQLLAVKATEVIRALFKMGMPATAAQTIDQDTAILVTEELGHKGVAARDVSAEARLAGETEEAGEQEHLLQPRPPVVTVMGHVDHGKTTLLDVIRQTRVAAQEAGGITQRIGAYHVITPKGVMTFLDTPGHAAFAQMRARGASVTDIVVLVVAADDGVMPQTVEAIQQARAAHCPIVVAVTKIDRPNADVEHVLQQLAQHELIPESWGGDVQVVPVAATQGKGIDELLDAILVQAEVMELKARREGPAKGVVIEAWLDPGRGALASILVQQGTLHQGDWLLAGTETGRVRQLMNEQGQPIKEVGPSLPALVAGLSGVPDAGVSAMVVRDEATAREVAQAREARLREERLSERKTPDAQSAMERLLGNQQGNKVLRYLIKADSKGTAEALRHAVAAMGNAEVHVEVVSAGVGMVSSSDVELAHTTGATIIAFNTRPDAASRKQLQEQHVPMMTHKIIYEVLEDVEAQVKGQMAPVVREHVIGHAQVREIFESSKMGKVAGCLVTEGVVRRNSPIRVLRRHVVVFEGKLESLRRFKENVEEVRSGVECGIAVRDYEDVRPGDEIEVFERIVEQPGAA